MTFWFQNFSLKRQITSFFWNLRSRESIFLKKNCQCLYNFRWVSYKYYLIERLIDILNLKTLQFSSVAQSCPTLCDPMNRSTPGLPVHHQLPEITQTHVHWVGDAIQPSYPLSSPSSPAPNPSQHRGLFQWVNSSREVAKVLEFQLQHQSFQ